MVPQFKRRLDVVHRQKLASCSGSNGKPIPAVFIAEHVDSKLLRRRGRHDHFQFDGIALDAVQQVQGVAFHRDVLHPSAVGTQLLQLPQWLHAQHTVLGQAELARERLDALLEIRPVQQGVEILQPVCLLHSVHPWRAPGPHDPTTVFRQQRFWCKEIPPGPVEQCMMIRKKFLVLEITEIVAGTQAVADAEKHPLVAHPEHVGA